MHYDIRQSEDESWEIIDQKTGRVAKLGTVLLKGLHYDEAKAAAHMLESQFVQAVRRKQNDSGMTEQKTASALASRSEQEGSLGYFSRCLRSFRLWRR